ncbi:hypothetical protein [Cohnella thailandensis]|uniref:Uncharacterized protein n=1 Tax=Cohnella thailandensis TaxID=557557 RepID=A0A841SZX3_9BACL|nr:hypothetical protein [Cohnella thailandensis]MBB6634341.1 hypothetical protein [Cohnella thailandensis]MBP1972160.1 hypothetical protein [Cohnella thailandensis]
MGTRLLSEQIIRQKYPHLRYIRIHTRGRNSADIYAWNEELQLPDKDRYELGQFAATYLTPYVCFHVKAYSMLKEDRVPRVEELPEPIYKAAMNRCLDQERLLSVVNGMFTNGRVSFRCYDPIAGRIHLDLWPNAPVTDIEKELLHRYLYELLPLGSSFEVTYR